MKLYYYLLLDFWDAFFAHLQNFTKIKKFGKHFVWNFEHPWTFPWVMWCPTQNRTWSVQPFWRLSNIQTKCHTDNKIKYIYINDLTRSISSFPCCLESSTRDTDCPGDKQICKFTIQSEPENSGIGRRLLDSSFNFNSPMNMRYSNWALSTNPCNFISGLITF